MKKITFKTAVLTAGIFTLGLTACKKEDITPGGSNKTKPAPQTDSEKAPVYREGIVSHDGFNSSGDIISGLYQFWGPFPNTYSAGVYGVGTTNALVKGCGGTTANIIYAYKTATNVQYLGSMLYGNVPIMSAATVPFTPAIEEIEVHPQTGMVYALVTESNAKRVYSIDPTTGIYTPITVAGGPGSTLFGNVAVNGYKGGSISFVPDGSGGYELLFAHESTVYAAMGVVTWRFSISGTNLTNIPAKNFSYSGIPGTFGTGINTTYGNGQLYFARHGSSNALYALNPAGTTYSAVGVSIPNTNDFGYWKAF